MTSRRQVLITREPSGEIWATHLGQPITLRSPQELWNFVTLDVSRDRRSFARPPRRNQAEEAQAILAWSPPPKPTHQEVFAHLLAKLKESK